jgi:hypothetical protein
VTIMLHTDKSASYSSKDCSELISGQFLASHV